MPVNVHLGSQVSLFVLQSMEERIHWSVIHELSLLKFLTAIDIGSLHL